MSNMEKIRERLLYAEPETAFIVSDFLYISVYKIANKRFCVLKRMLKYGVLYVAYMKNPSIVSCFMSMQRQSL